MRVKITIAAIVIAGALVLFFLSGSGAQDEVLYMTPTEFRADAQHQSSRVRLKGNIVPGSVQTSADKMHLWFDIGDGSQKVRVHYAGAVPDAFQEGLEAVVDGRMGDKGVFEGRELVVKCPSKYESQPGQHPADATGTPS